MAVRGRSGRLGRRREGTVRVSGLGERAGWPLRLLRLRLGGRVDGRRSSQRSRRGDVTRRRRFPRLNLRLLLMRLGQSVLSRLSTRSSIRFNRVRSTRHCRLDGRWRRLGLLLLGKGCVERLRLRNGRGGGDRGGLLLLLPGRSRSRARRRVGGGQVEEGTVSAIPSLLPFKVCAMESPAGLLSKPQQGPPTQEMRSKGRKEAYLFNSLQLCPLRRVLLLLRLPVSLPTSRRSVQQIPEGVPSSYSRGSRRGRLEPVIRLDALQTRTPVKRPVGGCDSRRRVKRHPTRRGRLSICERLRRRGEGVRRVNVRWRRREEVRLSRRGRRDRHG